MRGAVRSEHALRTAALRRPGRAPRLLALAAVAGGVAAFAVVHADRSGGVPAARETAVPTYYRDVRPILQGRCVSCHTPGGVAPFSLRTYAAAKAHRHRIVAMTAARLMPPWYAERGYRPYRFDSSLTDAQLRTLRRWAATGGRRGNPKVKPVRVAPVEKPSLSRVDTQISIPRAYIPSGLDDYRCFLLDWTPARPVYITGVGVTPGSVGQVHHVTVVAADPAIVPAVQTIDAQSPGPGFGCSAGGSTGASPGLQLIGGWAPGSNGAVDLPAPNSGVHVLPGTRVIVQVHYHLGHAQHGATAKPDRTRVALKLDDSARPGVWMAVTNLQWLLSADRFRIPAGARDVRYSFTGDPRELAPFDTGEVNLSHGFEIYAASMHMHYLGTGGKLAIVHPDNSNDVLVALRNWDFRWQSVYFFTRPARFNVGDRLNLECRWDNTAANQPIIDGVRRKPNLVTWGENTDNEMCVGYLYVTEPSDSDPA